MDEHSTTYTTAAGTWRRGGVIEILSVLDDSIAIFPVDFVKGGGDNTWHYVLFVVALLVEVDARESWTISDAEGGIMDPQHTPVAGIYRYTSACSSKITFTRGPEYLSTIIAPSGIAATTSSASSDASHSQPDQATFRELLLARDSTCPITGDWPSECEAAHLVPASRPELYRLLGQEHNMFGADVGMLLNRTLHKAYDALRWSLYEKDGVYYVHFFTPSPNQRQYHGKQIPLSRFNPAFDPPDPALIAWHYAQAVRMRIRGFSVGMRSRGRGGDWSRDE